MRTTTPRSSISSFGPFCSNGSEPRSESLLYTPVHPDSRRTDSSCGLSAEALVHFYSKSTGVSHNSHMWDSRYGPPQLPW